MAAKTKLVRDGGSFEYCVNAIPGIAKKLPEKEEYLNEQTQKIDQEWRQKRLEFLRTKIRFDVLKSVTDESEFPKEFQKLPLRDQQTLIETNQNLRISRKQDYQGLLQPHAMKVKIPEKLNVIVKAEMRNRLLQTFSDLLSHYRPQKPNEINNTETTAEIYTRANNLPSLIKNDLDCLERMDEHKNKYDDEKNVNAERQKRQTLEEHFHILNQIVDIHLTDRVPRTNHLQADYLRAKAKTLEMKLRSLEEEVLCMTYTKDACAELEKIRRKMLTKMNSVRCEVAQLDKQLANYKSISGGSNYEHLVEQYGQLKGDIEGKLWALKELKSSETVPSNNTSVNL